MNIVDQIISRAVAERPAVTSGGLTLSFGELFERVSRATTWLESCVEFRCGQTRRVGLACENGVEYIVLALAILKAGGCLVPLADELTEPERAEVVTRTALCGVVVWRQGFETAEWQKVAGNPLACEAEFSELSAAFIRFSSGTTGRSKGVVLSHSKLLERITAANAGLEIGPSDRVLWMLPMAHHFAVSIMLYLYHGACTVLGEGHLAADVLYTAENNRATVMYGAPFHYSLLAADGGSYGWPDLRLAVSTAAALSLETARVFRERFAKPLVQGFGIIEIGLPLINRDGADEAPTAVGRPQTAFSVELRDEDGLAVTAGEIGELWIKGPGMFDAYLAPWQIAEEICVSGWFATGDLAEMDMAGRVHLRGRKKSVLNVSGMKVFPEEIEQVLEQHSAVQRCRVTGLHHAVLGTVPVADVILKDGEMLAPRELMQWCRESLSAYKVPVRVNFVRELPLTASGKVRRVG